MGTNLFRRLNLKNKVPKFTIEKFGGTVDFFQDTCSRFSILYFKGQPSKKNTSLEMPEGGEKKCIQNALNYIMPFLLK